MTYTTHGHWYGPGTPTEPPNAIARCGGPGMCAPCSTEAARAPEINIYRERAHLIAHLASLFPSVIVPGADPSAPDWPVIFINTVRGQLSWHLSRDDLDLFGHVPMAEPGAQVPTWDGHTTTEKYERIAALARDLCMP